MTATLLPLLLLLSPALPAAEPALAPKIPAVLARPLPEDLMKVTIHRLSNGLTVYLSPNHEEPRVTAWIAVRAGSKNDPADSTGMAHYLEHMLFKGSRNLGTVGYEKEKPSLDRILALYEKRFRSKDPEERKRIYGEIDKENQAASRFAAANELAKIYRQMGFRGLNAFTSDEETVYVVDLPSNHLAAWAKVEADRFAAPVFRLFQSELEAVYEEKNRSIDNPERLIGEEMNRRLYKVHPYGQQPTLGTIEHLKNPSLAKMYEFYDRWYRPNNMAIALSGDFDREAVLPLLERSFGGWKPVAPPAPKTWPLPKPKGREFFEVRYESEEKLVVAWPLVPRRHPDADALAVMDMVMDNSAAGIMNLTLNQAQKVKASGSSPSFYNDAGDWSVWAVPKLGQTLEQAEALVMEAVGRLKAGEFAEDDVRAVITNFEVSEKARLETNEGRVGYMASSFIQLEPWPETVGRLERMRRVTRADVVRMANKYLGSDRVVGYRRAGKPELPNIQKPGFTLVPLDETLLSAFAARVLAMPAAPPEPRWLVEGRDYKTADLPAGRLTVVPNPFNDLFSLDLRFPVGRRQEPRLCEALSLLDLAGAGSLSAEDFKKRLFALGSSLRYSCGERQAEVSLNGLDRNFWPSLSLMLQRFEEPRIASDTLKNMVEVAIGGHRDNKKDPGYQRHALEEYATRDRESAVLGEASDAQLKKLKETDLKSLMRGLLDYKRRSAYVGNRELGEVAKLLESSRRFKEGSAGPAVSYRKVPRTRVYFTHRDMVQSQVGASASDGVFDAAKAVDYQFLAHYLGGGMSAVIFQEIRESRALAYSAWGGYSGGARKGDENELFGGLGCQADKTAEATTLLAGLLRAPPWSEKRFVETSKSIEERYRTSPIPFRGVAPTLWSWEDQGIQGDPRPERFRRSLAYRLQDLEAFSARLKDRPLVLFVLGNRDRLGLGELAKLGEVQEKKVDDLFPY